MVNTDGDMIESHLRVLNALKRLDHCLDSLHLDLDEDGLLFTDLLSSLMPLAKQTQVETSANNDLSFQLFERN